MKYELAIFTRHSRSDSRLPFEPADISRLYTAYLCDVIRKALTIVERPVVHADENSPLKAEVLAQLGSGVDLEWRQPAGGHLGRQAAAVPVPCLIICANVPSIPVDYLVQAGDRLPDNDVILGPSIDGGVYLLGLREPTPALFEGGPWTEMESMEQTGGNGDVPQLFGAIRTRAAQLDLTTRLLPPWYRVDTVDDLRRLALDLETMPADSVDDCPFTRALLDSLDF